MAGSERSCRVALLVATNEMLAAPIGTSSAIATAWVGASDTARMAQPKTTPMAASNRVEGRLRKAVARPPTTAPAPMATMNQL